jgi:hypothetical protein
MGVTVRLPRAEAVTEELLAPGPGLGSDDVHLVRERVLAGVAPLAAELPAGERLVLDAFRFRTALRHPERCLHGEPPFVPSPTTCRRAVGLAAVDRCLRRPGLWPAEAVAQVLRSGADDAVRAEREALPRAPWWARWYAGLGPGAQAAVAADAVTWATQLWGGIDWASLPRPVVVGGRDDWWEPPRARLSVRGRVEVRVRGDSGMGLVVVGSGAPDAASRSELAFAALACALAGGVPARVLGLWPAAGAIRVVPVSARVLQAAADELVTAAATWVDAALERHAGRDRAPATLSSTGT